MRPEIPRLLYLLFLLGAAFPVTVAAQEREYRESEKEKSELGEGFESSGQFYSFLGDFTRSLQLSIPHERAGVSIAPFPSVQSPLTAFDVVSFFGPYNCAGRTRAILPDRTDPDLLFAGTNTGGLWKSTNGGFLWQPINDQTPGLNITCIDQNPFNPDEIYYGTGEHKVRKIRNKGNGVYKSSDHGLTFSVLPVTANDSFLLVNSVKHSRTDDSTLYVATSLNGLYRSVNGGSTFQTVFDNGKRLTDIECFPNGKVMFTAAFDGIYSSATGDSGTFVKIVSGLPVSGFSRIEMAYCDSFPLVMYALFADSVQDWSAGLEGAYRSADGGMTWNAIANPDTVALFVYPDYMLAIAVRPDNPNFVIAGGARASYSGNGGQGWAYLAYPRFDQHCYVFNKFNSNLFYAGNDQGLYRFNFTQYPYVKNDLMYSYNTVQIWGGSYFPVGNHFFVGAQDNVFQVNAPNDSMFVRINSYGSDGKNTHIHQQNPVIGYACGDFAEVFRSNNMNDSMPSFTRILNEMDADGDSVHDDDVWHENMLEMNYLDGNQLYMPTRDFLWRSINGGNNWSKVTASFAGTGSAPHPYVIGLSNSVTPVAYLGGTAGLFYRIDDVYNAVPGQETDLSFSSPPQLFSGGKISCLTVHPQDAGIVYATVSDVDSVSHIWKITDALTPTPLWTDISGNFNNIYNVYWIEPDPDNPDSVLFAATDCGLWFTTDGGINWFRETQVPLITIFQVRMRKSDRKLFIYTFGRGIWIGELPQLNTGTGYTNHTGLQIYPNPTTGICYVNPGTTARFDAYYITDTQGKILKSYRWESSYTASHEIDLGGFTPGIYFVEFRTSGSVIRKKLVKL